MIYGAKSCCASLEDCFHIEISLLKIEIQLVSIEISLVRQKFHTGNKIASLFSQQYHAELTPMHMIHDDSPPRV